jgi:hypothetical protein
VAKALHDTDFLAHRVIGWQSEMLSFGCRIQTEILLMTINVPVEDEFLKEIDGLIENKNSLSD